MRVLLVDDEIDLLDTISSYLVKNGIVVDTAQNLDIAKEAILNNDFDIVVLDRMLPDGDGLSLITFSKKSHRPQRFLVLSALTELEHKVSGLDLGAADYLGKPFEPLELLARIRNAMRRGLDTVPEVRRIGPLSFDVHTATFLIDDVPFVLRRTEALVLEALMVRPGAQVQRETLEARVYGYDKFVNPNSVETHISRLRKHIAARTDRIMIQAIRGVGYRLVEAIRPP